LGSCFHGAQFFQTPKSRPGKEAKALIPAEARIPVVTEKEIVPETEVREKFRRVKPRKLSGLDAGRAEHRAAARFGGASSARPGFREDGAS
jgi:hypothetical protein